MDQTLVIIMADGKELTFDPGTQINFSREQLRIIIKNSAGITGIHADRFAAMVQPLEPGTAPGSGSETGAACRIELAVTDRTGNARVIDIPGYQKATVDPAGNLLTIRGEKSLAVVNFDFLGCYRIHKGGR
jgi:hypothetical protein